MSIKTLLQEEIENELSDLAKMNLGTDEYKVTIDGITKLMVQMHEMEQSEIERREKAETRDIENDLKMQQMADERKDRRIKNWISVAGIIVPVFVTVWGTKKSFEFEKDGTITTIMGRGFINKLLPKK